MKKIALLCVVFILCNSLSGCAQASKKTSATSEKDRYVFLVAGFDEAAENTDVLFTVSYDSNKSEARVAQIPRDTYFAFGKVQNKINQLYASKVSGGVSQEKALRETTEEIASAFGASYDGFFGVKISTFKKIVDAIGGLDINLTEDKTIHLEGEDPIVLKRGSNHIDGESAERFVRYRSGYAMGDLGRIDAQKIFLNALFAKALSGLKLPTIIKVASIVEKEVITDVKLYDFINVFIDIINSKGDKKAFYATVPGEPVESKNGLSFYVLNRKSAAEMTARYMFADKAFDEKLKFLDSENESFSDVYYDDSIKLKEYTTDNISNLRIAKK